MSRIVLKCTQTAKIGREAALLARKSLLDLFMPIWYTIMGDIRFAGAKAQKSATPCGVAPRVD